MRIIHVAPGVAVEASGPWYSVVRLCESLIETGADAQVAALDWMPGNRTLPFLTTFPLGPGPRRLGSSPQMRRWLKERAASGRFDLIHNHSLWMMPNTYPGMVRRRYPSCRLIVSPRGTLSRWALSFKALRKKVFWCLVQERALRRSDCFHATAESEAEDIRRLGFTQPICILPNGIDVPPLEKIHGGRHRQLLFLGRVHPQKGVDILLRAWSAVQDRFRDWELLVAGPDEGGYLARLKALADALRLDRVVFCGPLYGKDKLHAYRSAELFVLPTHSENFGMTVAEALAAGTPAIVTVGAPWQGLIREGAGWWIEIGVDPLVASLEEALASSPARLARMGVAGRQWMMRDYSWGRLGEQYAAAYRWLLEDGDIPPSVRLN